MAHGRIVRNGSRTALARGIGEWQGDDLMIVFKDDVARSLCSQLGNPKVSHLFNQRNKQTQSPNMLVGAGLHPR